MNLENLTPNQLEAEYERAVPLISQYLPVFLEMKKKEVINTMVTSPDAKCVMEQVVIKYCALIVRGMDFLKQG